MSDNDNDNDSNNYRLNWRNHTSSSNGAKRVWRDHWSGDNFEVMPNGDFLKLRTFCRLFEIKLVEAEDE